MQDDAEAEFPAVAESASDARRFVTTTLVGWGCDGLIEKAQLLVSELVINAVSYVRSPARLRVSLTDATLRVEVHDAGGGFAQPGPTTHDQASGRGLAIVGALADRWGVEAETNGKSVWFELGRTG